jgi:hypothetical protein
LKVSLVDQGKTSEAGGAFSRHFVQDALHLLCLALCLGLIVAWTSLSLGFDTRQDTISNLLAIWQGRPLHFGGAEAPPLPVYNRLLVPGLHRMLVLYAPFGSAGQWYLVLRIVTFQAAFVAFVFVCRFSLSMGKRDICLASTLFALAAIVTFNFQWEEPADAVDLLALTLGVGAALARRYWLCLALSILFAFNRESAAYLGLIWIVLTIRPSSVPRALVEGGAICVASYGLVIATRHFMRPGGSGNWDSLGRNLQAIMGSLADFNPLHWLAMLVAIVALLALNIRLKEPLPRSFVLLAVIFSGAALVFGQINELRVHLPAFLMLVFAVASGSPSRRALLTPK